LATCCNNIEEHLKSNRTGILGGDFIFSWNDVPGNDNGILLEHLKQELNLESIELAEDIKKEDSEQASKIIINISDEAPIIIILDKARKKVEVMSKYKKLEYDAFFPNQDKKIIVCNNTPQDESIKNMISDAREKMEQLIYGFVYNLASSSTKDPQASYYKQLLSTDKRFISVLQAIYDNRHRVFERGYRMLTSSK
jgi:hypothetical protein